LFTLDMKFPNGLAFAPGEKVLYVNDMMSKTILRFDVLPDDTITNGRLFIDEDPAKTEPYPNVGYPDGMKVDKKGNVYCTGPGGVWIISPEGKHLGTILISVHAVNLAFGEPDGKTLFVTCRPGLYRIRVMIPGIRP
jgi:gluconolactonase